MEDVWVNTKIDEDIENYAIYNSFKYLYMEGAFEDNAGNAVVIGEENSEIINLDMLSRISEIK